MIEVGQVFVSKELLKKYPHIYIFSDCRIKVCKIKNYSIYFKWFSIYHLNELEIFEFCKIISDFLQEFRPLTELELNELMVQEIIE